MTPQLGVWILTLFAAVHPLEEERFTFIYEQQTDASCGIASVSSLVSVYWGVEVTEKDLLAFLFNGDEALISLYDLQLLLEHLGFAAGGFRLSYGELREAAERYGPLICHLQGDEGHFVLFLGDLDDFALLGDPARGCIAVSAEEFAATWSGAAIAVFHPDYPLRSQTVTAVLESTGARLRALSTWCLK